MIKVEVVFEDVFFFFYGFYISFDKNGGDYPFVVCKNGIVIESFNWIEIAIKYCLEN